MIFKRKKYDEIFNEALQDALSAELISHEEDFARYVKDRKDIENFYVMLLSIMSKSFEGLYKQMQLIYDSRDIKKATGIDLDNIGAILGIPRPSATKAYADITFFLKNPQEESVTISAGVDVKTVDGIVYRTVEELYFAPGTTTSAQIPAYATLPGTKSKVEKNTLNKILSGLPFSTSNISCTNPRASSGGTEAANDEEYRNYLMNWFTTHQKGNEKAYEYYFRNLDGLDSYKLVPRFDGPGTIKIILDPDSATIKNKVMNEIQSQVGLWDDYVYVTGATSKPIDINSVINVDIDQLNPYSDAEKSIIKSKIKEAISLYIDGGYRQNRTYYKGLGIGEDFIPHKCAVFLDSEVPEIGNIRFNYPEDYIMVRDDEIAVSGNIKVEVL